MGNQYDGKSFTLEAINDLAPGQFYIIADGMSPVAIRGSFHGGRYDIDPFDNGQAVRDPRAGNSDNYTQGPFVGPEMLELRAKLGGAPAGTDNWPATVPIATHDDGTPWTSVECAAFRGPISAGPNAGPDLAPTYKQVGNTIVPVAAVPTTSAPVVAATPTPPPDAHATVAAIVQQVRDVASKQTTSLPSSKKLHSVANALEEFFAGLFHRGS